MGFLKKFTKQEISWMMYDWANSAHSVIVVTILPIFFDSVASCTADSVSSMSTWGYATSIAMAIVALAAPFLGVFGDIRGMRKKLFTAFLLLGVVSVTGLAFTPLMDFTSSTAAASKVAMLVLVLYILSTIGFDASCIYYDAFLTDVTTEDRMDSVSTLGYGLGYIGGSTIPLLIFLIMNAVGVPMLTSLAIIFAITAVWWLVFSLPLLKNCEQTTGKPYEKGDVGASIKNVFTTMKEIGADKPMLVYILSYFFYIDGVHTIISMSTSYGTNLGLDSAGMLLALLLVQVLGLPFCLLYMKLAAKFGARTMVGVGICVYMFICVFAYFMNSLWQFWMLAVLCAVSYTHLPRERWQDHRGAAARYQRPLPLHPAVCRLIASARIICYNARGRPVSAPFLVAAMALQPIKEGIPHGKHTRRADRYERRRGQLGRGLPDERGGLPLHGRNHAPVPERGSWPMRFSHLLLGKRCRGCRRCGVPAGYPI